MPVMRPPKTKDERRYRRHLRVRKKVSGTTERPRLVIRRSLKHIYAQLVDDTDRRTRQGSGDYEGRVRSRWISISWPREGAGRRCPRRRAGVLKTWLKRHIV